jgi:hypothetical protein
MGVAVPHRPCPLRADCAEQGCGSTRRVRRRRRWRASALQRAAVAVDGGRDLRARRRTSWLSRLLQLFWPPCGERRQAVTRCGSTRRTTNRDTAPPPGTTRSPAPNEGACPQPCRVHPSRRVHRRRRSTVIGAGTGERRIGDHLRDASGRHAGCPWCDPLGSDPRSRAPLRTHTPSADRPRARPRPDRLWSRRRWCVEVTFRRPCAPGTMRPAAVDRQERSHAPRLPARPCSRSSRASARAPRPASRRRIAATAWYPKPCRHLGDALAPIGALSGGAGLGSTAPKPATKTPPISRRLGLRR